MSSSESIKKSQEYITIGNYPVVINGRYSTLRDSTVFGTLIKKNTILFVKQITSDVIFKFYDDSESKFKDFVADQELVNILLN